MNPFAFFSSLSFSPSVIGYSVVAQHCHLVTPPMAGGQEEEEKDGRLVLVCVSVCVCVCVRVRARVRVWACKPHVVT